MILHHILGQSCKVLVLKKPHGPFLWMGFNCLKVKEPLWGDSLLFTIKFPENHGTHFIDLGRKKGWVKPWSHPMVLNARPLDWESNALTTRPLLLNWQPFSRMCLWKFWIFSGKGLPEGLFPKPSELWLKELISQFHNFP